MWNDQEEKGSTLTWSNWTGDNNYLKKEKKEEEEKGSSGRSQTCSNT